ncbi:GntR family transcriptional regulator [uncultured Paracoccus sp.]|uniref:GntR family transcriptional regulator n=1 Tax=uncultured Paracoccus sp. TaxID=189685 RepID=UPI00262A333E|nr:GntR family transcriptional regulator [uncultured Paracoccus sp.]
MLQPPVSLAERVAADIRDLIARGALRPGQRLSEAGMAERLGVSRNTLREAFRSLTNEGLVTYEANRGVSVAVPSMAAVIDIYRVRRMIEMQALRTAFPQHPAVARMAAAVDMAEDHGSRKDWLGVGNANMEFHAAIVDLADSPRLNEFFLKLATELRLAFGLLDEPEMMHAPYVPMNRDLVAMVKRGESEDAARRLEQYLLQSERAVLAALTRLNTAHP